MNSPELTGILEFLRNAERLKNTTRSSYTSTGRHESVAEHTWRLCLMALVFEEFFPKVDIARLLKICIVHDLGEAIGGDIPAPKQSEASQKAQTERRDLIKLLGSSSESLVKKIVDLWDEYEEAQTPEAKTAKALDKLETIIQHNQGKNPADFDYSYNLGYGREYTSDHPFISTIREILDQETRRNAKKSEKNRNQ